MRTLLPTEPQWAAVLGERLVARRLHADLSRNGVQDVDRRTVMRLERGARQVVPLGLVYLLCQRYGCAIGRLLHEGPDEEDFGAWPNNATSLPATLDHARQRLREARTAGAWGAKRLHKASNIANARPSWLFRLEYGELASFDLVRVTRLCAVMNRSVVELLPDDLR